MELWQEMTREMLLSGEIKIMLTEECAKALESRCFMALQQIREVIRDDTINDAECFMRIEEIISILENLGSHGGFRHDFG